jgi:proline iminopeptidase
MRPQLKLPMAKRTWSIFETAMLLSLLAFGTRLSLAESSPQRVEQGYVATHDGSRLFYQKLGKGPVLIVPGRLFLFENFRQLADTHTLISYDMRNRGRSDPISDGQKLTIDKDVRDLETVRRHFGVARFTPIGYSYLGLMVVMYAMGYPERVERIVQIGPVPIRFGTEYPPNLVATDGEAVLDQAELTKLRNLQKSDYPKAHPKEYCEREWAVTRYRLVGDPANVEKLGSSRCDMPNEWPVNLQKHFQYAFVSVQNLKLSKADVALVKNPVLTIHGTKDRNAPYGSGREWAMTLPNARLLTIENAAHNCFAEYPEIVFPAIRQFLAGNWPKSAEKVISTGREPTP